MLVLGVQECVQQDDKRARHESAATRAALLSLSWPVVTPAHVLLHVSFCKQATHTRHQPRQHTTKSNKQQPHQGQPQQARCLSSHLSTALGHVASCVTHQGDPALAAARAGVLWDGVCLNPVEWCWCWCLWVVRRWERHSNNTRDKPKGAQNHGVKEDTRWGRRRGRCDSGQAVVWWESRLCRPVTLKKHCRAAVAPSQPNHKTFPSSLNQPQKHT